MELKFLILFASVVGCTLGIESIPKVDLPVKSVEGSAAVPVEQEVKKEASITPESNPPQGKSLEDEGIRLYRHDQAAGVYRTEGGELVRMYRVERVNPATASKLTMPVKRRLPPMMPMKQRDSNSEMDMSRQRMFGDWWSNGLGLDPYSTTSYGYNYNYGIGLGNYGNYGNYPYYNNYNLNPYGGNYGYSSCFSGLYC